MTPLRPRHVHPTPLTALVAGLGASGDITSDTLISDITLDSRDAAPGTLWVAMPGDRTHGASHAVSAVRAGASAILTDADGAALIGDTDVPVVVSRALREDTGNVAARVFDNPAQRLLTLGVTGTNGKTTTVALLEAALHAAGLAVGTVGTIGFRLRGEELESARSTVTTPQAPDLQALLAVMADSGADAVALEVSSHAMAQERVTGMTLDVAGFLNLGTDHLDFHGTQQRYFEAKAALFTPAHARAAVCWTDDTHGALIAERAGREGLRVVTVGTGRGVDVRLRDWEPEPPLGGRATLRMGGRDLKLVIALPGMHNMIDAAVAVAMADVAGIPLPAVLDGLRSAQVPGRMQRLDLPEGAPTVIVDFAHTPQAVTASLEALSQSFSHVITVLGCGGDRDRDKRPLMGLAAAQLSDVLVVTDDNPRTEDPATIRQEMLAGIQNPRGRVIEIAGRGAAIEHALAGSTAGSVVAILGKGHERGQQIGHDVLEFDDAVQARRAWSTITEGSRP